ncbi:MAG: hypothetical protein WDW38_008921 [Sanguina aurantia]
MRMEPFMRSLDYHVNTAASGLGLDMDSLQAKKAHDKLLQRSADAKPNLPPHPNTTITASSCAFTSARPFHMCGTATLAVLANAKPNIPPHNKAALSAQTAYPLEGLLESSAHVTLLEGIWAQLFNIAMDPAAEAESKEYRTVDSYVLGRLTLLHDPDADRALRAAKYLALTHACLRVSQARFSLTPKNGVRQLAEQWHVPEDLAGWFVSKFYRQRAVSGWCACTSGGCSLLWTACARPLSDVWPLARCSHGGPRPQAREGHRRERGERPTVELLAASRSLRPSCFSLESEWRGGVLGVITQARLPQISPFPRQRHHPVPIPAVSRSLVRDAPDPPLPWPLWSRGPFPHDSWQGIVERLERHQPPRKPPPPAMQHGQSRPPLPLDTPTQPTPARALPHQHACPWQNNVETFERDQPQSNLLKLYTLVAALAADHGALAALQFEQLRAVWRMTADDLATLFRQLGAELTHTVVSDPVSDAAPVIRSYRVSLLSSRGAHAGKTLGECLPLLKPKLQRK